MKKIYQYYILTSLIVLLIGIPFLWGVLPKYYLVSVAKGESMHPTLSDNELCIFRVGGDIKEWDIILYIDGEGLIVHRLVYIDKNSGLYYCIGDGNKSGDYGISRDQIVGKLIYHIPSWKFNTIFISMIVISAIGVIYFTRKILRGDKND